jgi:hypothetical protein
MTPIAGVAGTAGQQQQQPPRRRSIPPFVLDTFPGVDGTLLTAHTGEIGATWTQHSASTGTLEIRTNQLRNTAALVGKYLASGTPPSPNYDVQADFVLITDDNASTMGLLGRYDAAADTGYMARYLATTDSWQLLKVVAGAGTQLGSLSATPLVGTQTAILRMTGTSISVIVGGAVLVGPVTDGAITAAGKAGAYGGGSGANNAGVRIDNFIAR